MSKRRVFTVATPLGDTVFLTRDRWRQITRFKHPAMTGKEALVRNCLVSPETIRESDKDDEVHLYYKAADDLFVCVVTAPAERDERFVVTAYLTKRIKQGNELWIS